MNEQNFQATCEELIWLVPGLPLGTLNAYKFQLQSKRKRSGSVKFWVLLLFNTIKFHIIETYFILYNWMNKFEELIWLVHRKAY